MLIPIAMLLLSLFVAQPINRWLNIGFAIFLILFNAVGLPSYEGYYATFLLVVGLLIKGLTTWIAWGWKPTG